MNRSEIETYKEFTDQPSSHPMMHRLLDRWEAWWDNLPAWIMFPLLIVLTVLAIGYVWVLIPGWLVGIPIYFLLPRNITKSTVARFIIMNISAAIFWSIYFYFRK